MIRALLVVALATVGASCTDPLPPCTGAAPTDGTAKIVHEC